MIIFTDCKQLIADWRVCLVATSTSYSKHALVQASLSAAKPLSSESCDCPGSHAHVPGSLIKNEGVVLCVQERSLADGPDKQLCAFQAALQAQGYTEWGITLMSAYTSIPMPGNFTFPCSVKYGVFCLGEQQPHSIRVVQSARL